MNGGFLNTGAIMAVLLSLAGCAPSPDAALSEAVARYHKNDPDSLERIEKAFMRKISKDRFNPRRLLCGNDALYRKGGGAVEIILPKRHDISSGSLARISSFYSGGEFSAASDGLLVEIYGSKDQI